MVVQVRQLQRLKEERRHFLKAPSVQRVQGEPSCARGPRRAPLHGRRNGISTFHASNAHIGSARVETEYSLSQHHPSGDFRGQCASELGSHFGNRLVRATRIALATKNLCLSTNQTSPNTAVVC